MKLKRNSGINNVSVFEMHQELMHAACWWWNASAKEQCDYWKGKMLKLSAELLDMLSDEDRRFVLRSLAPQVATEILFNLLAYENEFDCYREFVAMCKDYGLDVGDDEMATVYDMIMAARV